jgi:hypothetical protein
LAIANPDPSAMTPAMAEPSVSSVKRLFALSGNRCAFPKCGCPIVEPSGTVTGIICHIKARSKGGPRYDARQTQEERHGFPNLVLMCSRHSKLIDSEPRTYSVELLGEMKAIHERTGSIELSQAEARLALRLLEDYRNIYITTTGPVSVHQPKQVVIKTQRKTVKLEAPEGSIAADRSRRNYVKHLIDRYNDFAAQQPGRKFSFAAIFADIKKRFGAKWDFIGLEQFDSLCAYMQQKIDRTMRGSANRGHGHPNYSDYDDYVRKYESR